MRLFVYPSAKTRQSIAVLECDKVSKDKATVPSNVNLAGIRPGMICHPGEGRQVDRTITHVIAEVDAKKGILIFGIAIPKTVDAIPDEGQNP